MQIDYEYLSDLQLHLFGVHWERFRRWLGHSSGNRRRKWAHLTFLKANSYDQNK